MDSFKCLLVLTSCCLIFATSQSFPDLDTANLLSFQGEPKSGHVEVLKDDVVKKVYAQLLGKRMLQINTPSIIVEREPITAGTAPVATGLPEVMLLHRQLQNKLGWGSDDNSGGQNYPPPQQQYGPPPNQPPQQQYGPPPNQPPQQQYGPPPNQPPQQQYGPPPNQPPQQQYGPPPNQPPQQQYGPLPNQPPQQQYGPPPNQPPQQQYGPPPQQQYGPPPNQPPQQQYGPPPNESPPASSSWQPSSNYGAPQSGQSAVSQPTPSQEYGSNLRVNQGVFGGHIQNSDNHSELKSLYTSVFKDTSGLKDASAEYRTPDTNSNVLDNGNSKIYKHVYIHTPPAEKEVAQEPRVIRPKQGQDTHYQIIFVKAPAPPQQPPVTVELPSPPERKTLVYVLVKKNDKQQQITFKTPPSTPPPQPEVYFIRYKGGRNRKPSMTLSDIESNAIGGSNDDLMDFSNEGYSNDNQKSLADFSIRTKSKGKGKESAGYPDTEYRATPNMLGPNHEPMSFDVYDKIRNSVVPTSSRGTSLMAAASSIIPQTAARRQIPIRRSHYVAPGSVPFDTPSGRMINGEYIGMSSDLLRSQFFTTPYE